MSSNNKNNNGTKGQKTLASFFGKRKKKESSSTKEGKENDNNIMGIDSNQRKPAIQKQKAFAYSGNRSKAKKITQTTISGRIAEGRCDEGTKVCKACEKLKVNPNFKSFAHHPTCVKNGNYKKTNGGRISMVQYHLNLAEEEQLKNLKKPFSGKELCSIGGHTQDDVDTFFAPRKGDSDTKTVAVTNVDCKESIGSHYETKKWIERVTDRMKNPTHAMRRGKSVPMVVAAGIQSLLDLIPVRFKKGTNNLYSNNKTSITYKKLQAYQQKFPPGTIGFTFPHADKSQPPNHYYNQLEGRTVYFVCWELNIEGWEPTCFKCGETMVHDEYDFQSHGFATPIFDISGVTDYACSMYYNCTCGNRCKANDGRMLMNVQSHYRSAYPVDPRYAVNKETHISQNFLRVMDKMFITHGNGDQLSLMLNELRGDNYLDREEEYYSQAIAAGCKVPTTLPTFENYIGRYSPTGADLRNLKDYAAYSDLLSMCVSDKDRCQREMQSVGCNITSASDHTFEFRKNYAAGLLPDNACGHTMGSDTGEIASLAIVKDTSQTEYAHQAEQCTLRSNWNPKVHTADNCPAGIDLWKKLVRGVHCQLGLFHYMYRIAKTINKECNTWRAALASLQTCMYFYEEGDIEKVKRCLEAGTLGKINGEKCPQDQIQVKAKSYREYVRIWTYDSATIYSKLADWLFTYRDECDEKGEYLFTKDTSKTVMEQMRKSKWVVDTLTKDELYLEVQATLKSATGLKSYIGARGSESKLEKGHHAIAHFANGGMRHTLADFLGIGGLALYNLRIRYRLRVAKMMPADRAKIPVGFQRSPHFTNHLRLAYNNKLGREAGLNVDAHKLVEVLQPDNGERFFYEYYLQQEKRREEGITYDLINRCQCKKCGSDNPYRKRKTICTSQDDINPTTTKPAPIPVPAPLPTLAPALTLIPPWMPLEPQSTVQPSLAVVMPYSALASGKPTRWRRKKKQD